MQQLSNKGTLFGKGVEFSCNTWETKRNNNIAVLGPSGAGKTRYVLKPNLLQMNSSYIVLDTKGTLYREVGPVLEANGYEVWNISFTDMEGTIGYNPLDFVRYSTHDDGTLRPSEQDIREIARYAAPNNVRKDDAWWGLAAQNLLAALIAYVCEQLPEEQRNFTEVVKLHHGLSDGSTKRAFAELPFTDPQSVALRIFKGYSLGDKADKMQASIMGILEVAIRCLSMKSVQELMAQAKRINFAELEKRKIALFATISDVELGMAPLTSLFVAQAFQQLIRTADANPGGRLQIPVRFFLDDFANLNIEGFEGIISIIRSREIWCTLLCQTIAQLRNLYGEAGGETIMGNCDSKLVLACQDYEMANYFAKSANCSTSEMLGMPLNKSWLFIRGETPRQVELYDVEQHPALVAYNKQFAQGTTELDLTSEQSDNDMTSNYS